MKEKPLFIAFEGIDGSGKSTQIKHLASHLISQGFKVHLTCEPTDGKIGQMIRDIFNHKAEGHQKVIAALFAADRLEHLLHSENGILKKMAEGYTVITDRYYFSSYAYHSVHDIDLNWVISANSLAASILKPDINIYIDISPEESMSRINKHRTNIEMYETLENLSKVYKMYDEVFLNLKDVENICRVDGTQSVELVGQEIKREIEKLLV
jgi:dTMP kinase